MFLTLADISFMKTIKNSVLRMLTQGTELFTLDLNICHQSLLFAFVFSKIVLSNLSGLRQIHVLLACILVLHDKLYQTPWKSAET